MDFFSIIGLILGFVGVIGGMILEGGHPGDLLQVTAFMIVIMGSFGATLVATLPSDAINALKSFKWIFLPPKYPFHSLM